MPLQAWSLAANLNYNLDVLAAGKIRPQRIVCKYKITVILCEPYGTYIGYLFAYDPYLELGFTEELSTFLRTKTMEIYETLQD